MGWDRLCRGDKFHTGKAVDPATGDLEKQKIGGLITGRSRLSFILPT